MSFPSVSRDIFSSLVSGVFSLLSCWSFPFAVIYSSHFSLPLDVYFLIRRVFKLSTERPANSSCVYIISQQRDTQMFLTSCASESKHQEIRCNVRIFNYKADSGLSLHLRVVINLRCNKLFKREGEPPFELQDILLRMIDLFARA